MAAITRNLTILDPETSDIEELNQIIKETPVELIAVIFQFNAKVDIGAMCYTRNLNSARASIKDVSCNDFRADRTEALKNWLLAKISKYYRTGRIKTFYGEATQFRQFISWADTNGYHNVLASADDYKSVLQHYSIRMKPEVDEGRLDRKTVRNRQLEFQKSGRLLFPGTAVNFETDMPVIWTASTNNNSTLTPIEDDLGATVGLCEAIFDQFTYFLINNIKFPFKIKFPKTDGTLIPAEYVLITPILLQSSASKIASSITWDYKECRIRGYEEIVALSSTGTKSVSQLLTKAHKQYALANSDIFHPTRRWVLKQAHDAFLTLFMANSGINEQQARDLPWNSSYTIINDENHGFAAIKYRAHNKKIKITIKKTFISRFKKYLNLRKFVAQQYELSNLFFNVNGNNGELTSKISQSALQGFGVTVRTFIDPEYPALNSLEIRKYKSVFLLSQGYPVSVVASVMQHSQETSQKHYSDPNERVSVDEISSMLLKLVNNIENFKPKDTPAGNCSSEGQPLALHKIPDGYAPNCKNFSGCIFCQHFRTHADQESIRKILSMRYVIQERITLCEDADHFKRVHGDVISRIDLILDSLIAARPEMKKVVEQVLDEINKKFKLTDYWNRQLYRIYKLRGVV